MNDNWSDHLEILTGRLFHTLENYKRDEPFSCYLNSRTYFTNYIKSFELRKVNKSLGASWDYLKQGNVFFKPTPERISCYSQSLFYAPENSPSVIIAYLKRSSLLLKTGYVKESETDSFMALQWFIRYINKPVNEIVSVTKDPQMLGKFVEGNLRKFMLPKEEIYYVKREIMNLLKKHVESGTLNVVHKVNECSLPLLKNGENVDFPSSSNTLRVEYSEAKGRHVIANCDIKMGDVLFVEKPFSFVAHNPCCSHCCQIRYAYIPCNRCRDVRYCSIACRNEDWTSFHRYECGFVELLKKTGIGYLALRTLLKAESDIEKLKTLSETLKARETCSNTVFSTLTYENVHNLLDHSERIPITDFFHYSLTALLLSFYLVHYTRYAEETEENVYFCATILLRHIIQFVANANAITATEIEVDESCATIAKEPEQIGSAIYPSVSIMNHSCQPSVHITFRNSYIIVKAAKDIQKGEEVFNTYGVDCRRISRRDRQGILRAQYLFDCDCEPCGEKYDRYDILNSFKCGQCMGPLVKESETDTDMKSQERLCLTCNHRQTIPEEILALELNMSDILNYGDECLKKNEISDALTIFLEGWKLSRKHFFAFHIHISCLAKKIAVCLFRLNNFKECMKVLSCNLVCVEGRVGPYNPELAIEAKKLSDVIMYYCRNVQKTGSVSETDALTCEEKEYFEKCKQILGALYGDDHPLVSRDVQNKPIPEYTG